MDLMQGYEQRRDDIKYRVTFKLDDFILQCKLNYRTIKRNYGGLEVIDFI